MRGLTRLLMYNNLLAVSQKAVAEGNRGPLPSPPSPPLPSLKLQLHTHLYFMLVWRPMASFM